MGSIDYGIYPFLISGPYGSSDVGRMYSSNFGGDYMSRGSDVCFEVLSYVIILVFCHVIVKCARAYKL